MVEITIDNKNGNMWDITNIVSNISWKTSSIGKAGSLDFTLIKNCLYQDPAFQYNNGDVVKVKMGSANIFYGYIFTIDEGKDETVSVTCYDQIRYLMAKDTYVFNDVTASAVVRRIAEDFTLELGKIDDTAYRIPTMVEDGKVLLDIICKALTLTLINSNKNFFLFDDFGALSLRNSEDLLLDFYIGDDSLMIDYSNKTSIDTDTYNKIKLYKDNEATGRREIYMAQDSNNIDKWGILQLYQSVEENMNTAQINQQLDTLITLKNRESKTLKIKALGDIRVRAGAYIPIIIKEYGINQPFIIDECTHSFNGADHTMSLDLKVVT
ncbi:XkdQ/YqbQ family protein [Alkaliphilus peptidifermentans]|uniref:YqbQ/XkdQ domain-containing protein n=1 Tax=Alkaliphilus peptidifermentans DSM 18978 TaxID=1120976 RepID=A0A1G5JZL6_9FIRM|nr:hypothetical protein [Alkaliphilus peptidifermentans]SCY93208.1 hypothetical protein SAMN03080606_03112 [Alkaliphilus peptidifermentans DSM 18978]